MSYSQFIHRVTHPALFLVYLFRRLPAAWFMGLRVLTCDRQAASVRLRYGWRSRNPFGSIYFAAQCAAGELSTGVLAMGAIAELGEPVSMLVAEVKAEFLKKPAKRSCLFALMARDCAKRYERRSKAASRRFTQRAARDFCPMARGHLKFTSAGLSSVKTKNERRCTQMALTSHPKNV